MIQEGYQKAKRLLKITAGLWAALILLGSLLYSLGIDFVSPVVSLAKTQSYGICLLIPFFLLLLFWQPALAVWRVYRFQSQLLYLNSRTRETLEYGFACGDRIGDLYFTNVGFVVHQCRWGAKIQFVYIPFSEVSDLWVRSDLPGKGQVLEIVRLKKPPCRIQMKVPISIEAVSNLSRKMKLLQAGTLSVHSDVEIQKRMAEREQLYTKARIKNSPLLLIAVSFCSLFFYAVGMLGILSLPAVLQRFLDDGFHVKAHRLFWPNLLFLLWTVGMEVFLFRFGVWFVRRHQSHAAEWRLYLKSVMFICFVFCFILFLATVYGDDQKVWEQLVIGFKILFM